MADLFDRYAPKGGDLFDRYEKKDGGSFVQRAGRYARGLIDEAANLGTGLSDELGAAVDATIPTQFLYPTSQADTWRQRYDENLAGERGRMKQFQEENPIAATTANVVGSVAGTVPALARVPALTAMGPSLVGNVGKMAGVGGVTGAVQGFGTGEGDFANRATNALIHGGVGMAVGGALPIVGAGAQKLLETGPGRYVSEKIVSPLVRTVASKFGGAAPKSLSAAAPDGSPGVMGPMKQFADKTGNVADTGAVSRLATALQRSGMSPEQVQARLKQLGPESVLADVDPQLLSAARSAHTLPGQTRSVAKNVLEGRDRLAGNRLTKAFEGAEPPPSAYALRGDGQAFDKNAAAVGQKFYDAMRNEKLHVSGDMQKLLNIKNVKDAIKSVENDAVSNGETYSAIEIADKVKQKLNRMARVASNTEALDTHAIGKLADRWEAAFWQANPEAEVASRAFRQAKSLPEHFDVGAALLAREGTSEPALEKSAARLTDLLAKADPQQKLAARTGSTNAARNQAQESTALARSLARRIDESAPVQSKLSDLYGPEWAGKIGNQAAAERQFAETSNEILRGSKTADKAAEAMLDTNAHVRVDTSGVLPRFIQYLRDIPETLVKPNEPVRDAIGRMTLNMDANEKERLVRALAAEIARRKQGSPLAASLAGSSGSLVPSGR